MKKTERLKWVEENFGSEFVLKYFYCTTWIEIKNAIQWFEKRNLTCGMRTDTRYGIQQKDKAPFILHCDSSQAFEIWQKHQSNLYYIVSENVIEVFCHGVARKVNNEEQIMVIEFNRKELYISQRAMHDHGDNLEIIAIGPYSRILNPFLILSADVFIPCFRTKYMDLDKINLYGFNTIYRLMFDWGVEIDEITFTVLPNKKVIIW